MKCFELTKISGAQ